MAYFFNHNAKFNNAMSCEIQIYQSIYSIELLKKLVILYRLIIWYAMCGKASATLKKSGWSKHIFNFYIFTFFTRATSYCVIDDLKPPKTSLCIWYPVKTFLQNCLKKYSFNSHKLSFILKKTIKKKTIIRL